MRLRAPPKLTSAFDIRSTCPPPTARRFPQKLHACAPVTLEEGAEWREELKGHAELDETPMRECGVTAVHRLPLQRHPLVNHAQLDEFCDGRRSCVVFDAVDHAVDVCQR